MNTIGRYAANLADERDSAALYRALAQTEQNSVISGLYNRLATTEEKHAAEWEKRILANGGRLPESRISIRTRLLIWLARHFGNDFILASLVSFENATFHDYSKQPEARSMLGEERSHAVLLQQLGNASHGRGVEGPVLARLEGRHRSAGGNALRAAVLGASDGLLSNFNLVMGVAGAEVGSGNILLTGLAGLLAGAVSMALGEWISVQSSRELYERQIRSEKEEIENDPAEEVEELVLIYQARGLSEELARPLAAKILENPETALDTLARDELGVDPSELGGSAWEAAVTSFLLFAVGAVIPVFPFLIADGQAAVAGCAAISAVGLFLVGAVTTLFTGRSVLYSGIRQVLFGLLAAAATYSIGRFIGSSLI